MSVICSMTGFASVSRSAGKDVEFTLTAKSVNHRFLDLQFRLPGGMDGLEQRLRQSAKAKLRRGHVDVTLMLERSGESELRVNEALLSSALQAFRTAAARYEVRGEPDLNLLLRLPGVMSVQRASVPEDGGELEEAVADAADELLDLLGTVRAQEGRALAAELRASMGRLLEMSAEIGRLRGSVRDGQIERLRLRMAEVLEGSPVSEERLLTEAALLVERSDIQEENVRLQTHVERFVAMLEEGGEVGKRLDFLLQELNREANTMLSKTGGAVGENGLRITEIGLGMKAEIERAREQVQNLE